MRKDVAGQEQALCPSIRIGLWTQESFLGPRCRLRNHLHGSNEGCERAFQSSRRIDELVEKAKSIDYFFRKCDSKRIEKNVKIIEGPAGRVKQVPENTCNGDFPNP